MDILCVARRRQAQNLWTTISLFAQSLVEDGSTLQIKSSMRGSILEINQRLLCNPELLVDAPWREGYLAILLPKMDEVAKIQRELSSEAEYCHSRGLEALPSPLSKCFRGFRFKRKKSQD